MDPLLISVILFVIALILFAIDVFVPTGAILIFCSAMTAIISVYFGFRSGTNAGLVMLLIVFATIPVLVWTFLRVWPNTPIGRRVLLKPPQASVSQDNDELREFVGKVVVNRWPLIPMGQVQIGHRRYNAKSSDGKTIDANQRVKVIDVSERILVVCATIEPLSDPSSRMTPTASGARAKGGAASNAAQPTNESLLETPAEQLGLESLTELPLDKED